MGRETILCYQSTMYGVPSKDNKAVEVYQDNEDGKPVLVAIAPVEDNSLYLDADEYCHLGFKMTDDGKDILARGWGYKDASECDEDEKFSPYLEKLTIPKGVVEFHCCDHGIKELIIPDSVKVAFFADNQLTSVNLPDGIEHVECSDNPGSDSFVFPKGCKYVFVGLNDPRNVGVKPYKPSLYETPWQPEELVIEVPATRAFIVITDD